jgi:hypothetical protein
LKIADPCHFSEMETQKRHTWTAWQYAGMETPHFHIERSSTFNGWRIPGRGTLAADARSGA